VGEARVARRFISIPKFGFVLEVLGMENVGIFYDHSEYSRPFGTYILWLLDNVEVIWYVFFPRFGKLFPEKSGNPGGGVEGLQRGNTFRKISFDPKSPQGPECKSNFDKGKKNGKKSRNNFFPLLLLFSRTSGNFQ
jgi:hypothetical protein